VEGGVESVHVGKIVLTGRGAGKGGEDGHSPDTREGIWGNLPIVISTKARLV